MIGQVGTGTPLVLVCLALLRSSAGRRRLNKKREKKEATWHGPPRCQAVTKNTRPRVAPLFPAGDCGAMRRGGGVFSSPAWPGRCKGEEGGGAAAALFAGARRPEEENKKIYYANATTTRAAA
jgi:hypothetical protein